MITRPEAIAIFQAYNRSFPDRVESLIRSAAAAGQTSLVINYGAQNVTDAVATTTRDQLTAAGWTAAVDTTAKTLTIS
jgi:hypothetical protein